MDLNLADAERLEDFEHVVEEIVSLATGGTSEVNGDVSEPYEAVERCLCPTRDRVLQM